MPTTIATKLEMQFLFVPFIFILLRIWSLLLTLIEVEGGVSLNCSTLFFFTYMGVSNFFTEFWWNFLKNNHHVSFYRVLVTQVKDLPMLFSLFSLLPKFGATSFVFFCVHGSVVD